ncbi:MAG TPA: acylphosphatase [Gammaproteobacteria bacterium]|nr:acylphosphatase [Gammaproteobacteria bacterium]
MARCRRFLVSGMVQGVFFRASTRTEAHRLGIGGYAANLANGCVEVVACGPDDALNELAAWLRHGPPRARVDSVEVEEVECETPADFSTR